MKKVISVFCFLAWVTPAVSCPEITGLFVCENSQDSYDMTFSKKDGVYHYVINQVDFFSDGEEAVVQDNWIKVVHQASCVKGESLRVLRDHTLSIEPGVTRSQSEIFSFAENQTDIFVDAFYAKNGVIAGQRVSLCRLQ